MKLLVVVFVLGMTAVTFGLQSENLFPVSIVHMNDFHARFEETNSQSNSCKEGERCIGGYARAVTTIKKLLNDRAATNPIYLNAGDNFQGTLWYNIGRWNVTSYFLNLLPADAITLGNHEFDHQVEGVVPFLETLTSPVIVCNIDDSEEPTMQGKYQKSLIIDRYDRKIGIVGVILSTTNTIASTGRLRFLNESVTVRAEAALLREQGCDIIIVLSHCGLDVDYIIARNAGPDIDVIVGGHSHTFMYTGEHPGPDYPQDVYPAVVTNADGHTVLIVQASSYAKYIGDLTVYFDDAGRVVRWEGAPVFLDEDIVQDPEIVRELQPWKAIVDLVGLKKVGSAKVPLSRSGCGYQECNMGNFVADAFAHQAIAMAEPGEWTYAAIALTNIGGVRTTLNAGDLTYYDLVATVPFENTLDTMELRGDYLREALEYSVSISWDEDRFNAANMLLFSGLKVVYNVSMPVNSRVVSVDVLCNKCLVPTYLPLDDTEKYRLVVGSFLAGGGDGFEVFSKYSENYRVGMVDINAMVAYVERMSPIFSGANGRIKIIT